MSTGPSSQLAVVVTHKVRPGMEDEFLSLLTPVLDAMRHEPTFISAALHRSPDDPTSFMLQEVWADRGDLVNVQMKRDYRATYEARLPGLLREPRRAEIWDRLRADFTFFARAQVLRQTSLASVRTAQSGASVLIETNRFLLREFTTEDTPAFVAYHRDPRYTALYGAEEAEPSHLSRLVETFIAWAEEQPRLNYQLAVCHKAGLMPLIGCAGLRRAGCREGEAELGIELAPDVWGRYRYAVEITQAILQLGFRHLQLERIFGFTLSANESVRRLAEWFGASVVETRPGPEWLQERGWMQVEWEVTPARWRDAARGSGAAFRLNSEDPPRRTGR